MDEEWRPVLGFEGEYEVSNLGRVRGVDRIITKLDRWGNTVDYRWAGRERVQSTRDTGYKCVFLKDKNKYVHRLVLEAFVGPQPEGMQACHNDGDPGNNRLDNLRWDTREENMQDVIRHGRNTRLNQTECKFGHLLEGANLLESAKPVQRKCISCARARTYVRNHPELDFSEVADIYYNGVMFGAPVPFSQGRPKSTECKRGHLREPWNLTGTGACKSCAYAKTYVRRHPGLDVEIVANEYYTKLERKASE